LWHDSVQSPSATDAAGYSQLIVNLAKIVADIAQPVERGCVRVMHNAGGEQIKKRS